MSTEHAILEEHSFEARTMYRSFFQQLLLVLLICSLIIYQNKYHFHIVLFVLVNDYFFEVMCASDGSEGGVALNVILLFIAIR